MEKRVTKRDGTLVPLNTSKIRNMIEYATVGIDGVDALALESDSNIQFTDGIKTKTIQNLIIKTAVDKIDVDSPNWTFVASRLFKASLNGDINKLLGTMDSVELLKINFDNGRYHRDLIDGIDIKDIREVVDDTFFEELDYLGSLSLRERYSIKDEHGNSIETHELVFIRVALGLVMLEKEDKLKHFKEFLGVLANLEVMSATPTLSNSGLAVSQKSSCYVTNTFNSVEGIMKTFSDMAILSKFGGGIGGTWGAVGSNGETVMNIPNAHNGKIPHMSTVNSIALSFDQLGTRAGAISTTIDGWDTDLINWIDLKKNTGEMRLRAHDIFPAISIPDLFKERYDNNEDWTLFRANDVIKLHHTYGEKWEEYYVECENNDSLYKETYKAKDIWKHILTSMFEHSGQFISYRDNVNLRNTNDHAGMVYSSNLCHEIHLNTYEGDEYVNLTMFDKVISFPSSYMMEIETKDGLKRVRTDKLVAGDIITGYKYDEILFAEKVILNSETAVCNLASVNVSRVHTQEDISRVVPIAIRMLDNVIDNNFYPIESALRFNKKYRSVGLGIMGEHELIANNKIHFASDEHNQYINELYARISFKAIEASSDLALERGSYPVFMGSKWSKGELPVDNIKESMFKAGFDYYKGLEWEWLRNKVKRDGMRNGNLMAIAPTSSIAIICRTTATVEPVYKRKWIEENKLGMIPIIAPGLNVDNFEYYTPAFEVDMVALVTTNAIRQMYIDQGVSLNIFIPRSKSSGKYLNDIYSTAHELGCKATYYLRSESPEIDDEDNDIIDRSIECFGCE